MKPVRLPSARLLERAPTGGVQGNSYPSRFTARNV